MTSLKPVLNTDGQDIAPTVMAAADAYGLYPIGLLALLYAESGLNPRAERWGRYPPDAARMLIDTGDHGALSVIIDVAWPDISFGYSQRIVFFHQLGDRTPNVANVLAVREAVFADPEGDIYGAAEKLAGCFQHPSWQGTTLSALVIYNAGSDRRSDPEWMARWAANVRSYERALAWAEQYWMAKEEEPHMPANIPAVVERITEALHAIWGVTALPGAMSTTERDLVQVQVVVIKRALGIQEEEEEDD